MDRHAGRQAYRQVHRQAGRFAGSKLIGRFRQICWQAGRFAGRQAGKHANQCCFTQLQPLVHEGVLLRISGYTSTLSAVEDRDLFC